MDALITCACRLLYGGPRIRWMIHSHCYVDGGAFTSTVLPCGAVEEADEVLAAIERAEKRPGPILVNLKGHGSLVMAETLDELEGLQFRHTHPSLG